MEKILNLDNLNEVILGLKSKRKKIVHCHGVFDLLHIGHIKHFQEAKSFGDILIVSITPDQFVNKGPGRPAFTSSLRLEYLAAIECIDYVVANQWPSSEEIIEIIKPNIYCKGPDYKDHKDDITGKIKDEQTAVESFGGKIVYTDDITFSSSSLLNKYGNLHSQDLESFIRKIANKHTFESIESNLKKLKKLKVLVIGESIIDQYVFCEALGKSGKEPVLVIRDLETQEYLGGALAIARHLSDFCQEVSVLSYLGEDGKYNSFIDENTENNLNLNFLSKQNSPTIVKRRFVDNIDRKKILGVYSINDNPLSEPEEDKFIEVFDSLYQEHDLIIISDYGHGIITPKIADYVSKKNKFISLNAQVNAANIGTHNIRKYKDVDCLIVNATELQHEMRQRDGDLEKLAIKLKDAINAKYLTVTKGKEGAFLMNEKKSTTNCPGFALEVVDKIGSGDALLALLSVCIYSDIEENLALFIASLGAAQSVESIGNSSPVNKLKLLKTISHFLK
jgi:rfaE bifunctional protein kinase chain/domain/rfaE bifunctional protein nucleotidyltransferase chain/domain